MRLMRASVATLIATVALSALTVTPAAAGPDDGQGCVGVPTIQAAYVCVISATPENALPSLTTSSIPVPVPPVCYFLDCTEPTTVHVPVPGASQGSGNVIVLWHNGVYYPIALTSGGVVTTLLDTVDLAGGVAETYAAAVVSLYQQTYQTVVEIADRNRYVQLLLGVVNAALEDPTDPGLWCRAVGTVVYIVLGPDSFTCSG